MTDHDILVHRYQVGHSAKVMRRLAQPDRPSLLSRAWIAFARWALGVIQ